MNLYKINEKNLVESRVKTNPQNVQEANVALFRATMNLPAAAKHCGMTEKELEMLSDRFLANTVMEDWDYELTEIESFPKGIE